jgi:hypothetical protein
MANYLGTKGNSTYSRSHSTFVDDAAELLKLLSKIDWKHNVKPTWRKKSPKVRFISIIMRKSCLEFIVGSPQGAQHIVVTFEGCEREFLSLILKSNQCKNNNAKKKKGLQFKNINQIY